MSDSSSRSASPEVAMKPMKQTRQSIGQKRRFNILLFGETGVGKSTFINAFCNYLIYDELKLAIKSKLMTFIPAKFTVTNEDYESETIEIGFDDNEHRGVGASATEYAKSYVFPIHSDKMEIRLIDTPGIADTRGVKIDNSNFENILDFIGEYEQLNAICILLKPNETRLTVQFEYCIKQLLSKLDKSAADNLIFIFTNSRSTFYRPGQTLPILRSLFKKLESVRIPLGKENIFCLDNEAFNFVAAYNHGIKFNESDVDNFSQSWTQSYLECWRMIDYITGDDNQPLLKPHLVKNTLSINDSRRLITSLVRPLVEIAQLIEDNIKVLERHKKSLQSNTTELSELALKLRIPLIYLEIKELPQPTTVCTAAKCSEVYKVNEVKKWHYKQRCHDPCYFTGAPKEIVGSPEIMNCSSMNRSDNAVVCRICGCRYELHMHIYYVSTTVENHIEDVNVKKEILDKENAGKQVKITIQKTEERLDEYKDEKDIIIKTTAKFTHFLKTNAITPYNDAYEGYLLYLIDREKSLGENTDYVTVRALEALLSTYKEEKSILTTMMKGASSADQITASDIMGAVSGLLKLKHNGQKIEKFLQAEKSARNDEH